MLKSKPNTSAEISKSNPAHNQAEISIFGPGIGECIVLHVGNGKWFIIDSCLDPATKYPVALNYLRDTLKVNLADDVLGIFITHWHKDHIDGAAEIIKNCTKANIYISGALLDKEMLSLVRLYKNDPFTNIDSEIREFRNIIDHLTETNQRGRLKLVISTSVFLQNQNPFFSRLVALSPSNSSLQQAITNIQTIVPKPGDSRRSACIPQSANFNAIALHFTFGDISLILGSDLENTGNIHTGWEALFTDDLPNKLGLSPADIFKVPHHGSYTGHHQKTLDSLISSNPISLATPFTRSSLPLDTDIKRISDFSHKFLLTKDPKIKKKISKDPVVEKEQKAMGVEQYAINDRIGHIQIRFSHTKIDSYALNTIAIEH